MLNRNDLDLIHQVLEIAVQTPGFIDTTSSGACNPEEERLLKLEMEQLMRKVSAELKEDITLERIENLEAYVTDIRRTMHVMTHTVYLLGMEGGTSRCLACGERFADKPGEMRT